MHPHIKYELETLERLILLSQPDKPKGTHQKALKTEVERIKQTFVHEVFTFEDERHLERYIQYHQQAIIRLMDRLLKPAAASSASSPEIQELHYACLDELLTFIERHFSKYFDQDAKAPQGYISLVQKDTRTNMRKFLKTLSDAQADTRLIDLIFRVLKKLLHSHTDKHLTYRKVLYTKEIQKELFRLIDRVQSITDINEELRQIIYYLNYNATPVLTYHAHYITALLEESQTRAEKLEKLSFMLKTVNQAQVKPGIRYHPHAPSLREQLSHYITEEIDYQEKLNQLSGNTQSPPPDSIQGFQLKFDASVSQLAYLVRIFLETKLIVNNNLSQVFHFLVRFIITRRTETISYASFRTKFYTVEDSTKISVRHLLQNMIQHIDKN
jgi:hypothetical protein